MIHALANKACCCQRYCNITVTVNTLTCTSINFAMSYQIRDARQKVRQSAEQDEGSTSPRVEFYDAPENAKLLVSFLGEIRTANNRYKSKYVRAKITELSPEGETVQEIGIRNLNLKRTVLRKKIEALEQEGRLQSEPYVILGLGEASTRDGMTKYYKYEVLSLSEALRKGIVR